MALILSPFCVIVIILLHIPNAITASLNLTRTIYPPNTGLNASSSPYTTPQNATIFALVYGSPLLDFTSFAAPVLLAKGTNAFLNQNTTANADSAAVIRPNADTLYSTAIVDLSQNDVAITIPTITDGRFYVCPFYDIYGDNFANLGTATNSAPGRYLLRRAQDGQVTPGLQLSEVPSGYLGVINYPTAYGFILNRILLRNNGSDVDVIHGYQSQLDMALVNRTTTSPPLPPPMSISLLNDSLTGSPVQQALQLTARLAPYDQPEILDEITNVTAILALAGISNGTYKQPPSVNLTAAAQVAELSIEADLENPAHQVDFGNDWVQFIPEISGDFHSDFAARAYIAKTGLAQLAPDETLYPQWTGEGSNVLYLAPGEATLFTFSGKPPVTGFWSLTAYGENDYLIPNPLDVYALGDRSNLAYPDGTPVYGDDCPDSEFQILIQPADVAPPKNWTTNWLPAPSGGGKFTVNLRWYGPTEALLNSSYIYPTVTNHTVFTTN